MMDQIAEAAANDSLMPMAGCASQNPGGTPRRRSSGTTAAPRSLTRPPIRQQGEHVEDAAGAIAIEVAAGGSSRPRTQQNREVRGFDLALAVEIPRVRRSARVEQIRRAGEVAVVVLPGGSGDGGGAGRRSYGKCRAIRGQPSLSSILGVSARAAPGRNILLGRVASL